ncbi:MULTISPECIES: ABC transporter permease [Rhodococcus]|uniref:ABC transporter permease n=1 Tax=Rhodococcus TaxID=1827 RepID=UPI0029538877|nr:ABC transporter permease [Rhodococcus sp. IEGM 1241]MDV8014089.1 ABC transporter permease [Rhodococcus sp. IEGM 1241]
MAVLSAERIKITTTKSPLWCTITIIVLGLGVAWMIGRSSSSSIQAYNDEAASGTPDFEKFLPTFNEAGLGVSGFGVMVLMIMAALAITSEYRFGIIRTTFQAIPSRASVLIAKAGLIGAFGAALSFVLMLGAVFITKAAAGSEGSTNLALDTADAWRAVYGVPIFAFLCVVLAIAVGALLRQSAGAIALLLLWPLLIESLFGMFGSFGRNVTPFLPFANADHFLSSGSSTNFHWGPWGSLFYFAAFVLVVFGISIAVVNKRDA